MRRVKSLAIGLVSVLAAGIIWLPGAAAADGNNCRSLSLPVALSDGGPANQRVSGILCTPATWADGPYEVDVLLHGATYNKTYWDFPVGSQGSYVADTLAAGRATFAYDAVGSGKSSRPPGALVTIDSGAFVLHQIVGWLRGAQGYTQVNGISHSLGSATLIDEAGNWSDINRVVITGFLHRASLAAFLHAGSFYPAMLDPEFPGLLDPTYLTTRPDTRGSLFYNATADPAVIAYDEAHKDLVSAAQIADAGAALEAPAALSISTHITAPVLSVVGDQDALICAQPSLFDCSSNASITANEAAFYPGAASLMVLSIPNTGHNLALHPSAGASFADINTWIQTH